MKRLIKIALADDELLFRQGVKAILQAEDKIRVLFDAENGQDLLDKLRIAKQKPQIIVTDLKMPELNGIDVTKIIRKEFPDIKIIALTSYFSKPFILNMISIGAAGYLAKNSAPKLMISTIKKVYENGFYYDEKIKKFIKENEKEAKQVKSTLDSNYFTLRELDVLNLICRQYLTKDIGDRLGISPRTVEVHRNNLLLKTQSKNIAGLVIYALKNKLVDLDSDFSFS
ncbi:LuxR family two component transcriptional regulator [Winogradskyella wandonensis]|uniref:LuxR family two component transcriptional regulator n=1 Tax=Winogradskyella wandonensis TaxID=1442586 RepID=A0A4R1KSQ5_9FLAO|nr:response regulator transcription factor [Winogradskyella wandonensis]TCK67633.1 LuxR family two component transcriptional regulator [Winogradskyella wandonensis]